jgi:hypothetical protein
MRADIAPVADHDVAFDDGVRPDGGIGADAGAFVNNRRGMNDGRH